MYKREVYLKRCIASSGDTLEMRDEVEVRTLGNPTEFDMLLT